MAYEGSCHCGKVRFAVEGDVPAQAISCNCSHCRAKGLVLTFVPASQFTLLSGADDLIEYRFNTRRIGHQFCATCGVQPFAEGEQGGTAMRAVNLRCVGAADLDALELQHYDGAAA